MLKVSQIQLIDFNGQLLYFLNYFLLKIALQIINLFNHFILNFFKIVRCYHNLFKKSLFQYLNYLQFDFIVINY